MSPEYAMGGIFSEKSDIYSFGVLILEIISGRKNTSFYYCEQHQAWMTFTDSDKMGVGAKASLAELPKLVLSANVFSFAVMCTFAIN
ncbi:unnamed protein product [Prunus brigantina]